MIDFPISIVCVRRGHSVEEPVVSVKTTLIKVQRKEENDVSSMKGEAAGKLHHHRSIELMRMLDDTPLVRSLTQSERLVETASTIDDMASVYSVGTECSSTIASTMNSNEDLTRKVLIIWLFVVSL